MALIGRAPAHFNTLEALKFEFVGSISLAFSVLLGIGCIPLTMAGQWEPLLILAGVISSYVLNRRGRLRAASVMLVAGPMLTLWWTSATAEMSTMKFICLILLSAGFLFGPRVALVLGAVNIAFAVALAQWRPGLSVIPAKTLDPLHDTAMISFIIFFAGVGFFAWFFGRISHDLGTDLLAKQRSLAKAEATLHQLLSQAQQSAIQVAETAAEMSATADMAAESTRQVSDTVEQLAQGASEQAMQVSEGADRTMRMRDDANRVSISADKASTASGQALSAVVTGHTALQAVMTTLRTLHGNVTKSAETVHRLGNLGDRIGSIVEMIKGIASQTNL
ncbi:MAG: hypothetical protein H7338_09720, partial [Candidatus Sericytochromatia bacterium]|nr:hypothetical protein [Candidatus Sericytochromatia bacterium]